MQRNIQRCYINKILKNTRNLRHLEKQSIKHLFLLYHLLDENSQYL